MNTVSQTHLDLFAGQHRVEVRVKIDRDDYPEGYWILEDSSGRPILDDYGATIEVAPFPAVDPLYEGKLFDVTITGGLFAEQSFGIGGCVSREIEVRFILGDAVIPRMAKIQPEIRLVNDSGIVSEWIPKGTFWLDTRELDKETGIMTIRGYDAMLKGEATYITEGDVGTWPRTMASVATEIAGLMGLEIDSRTVLNQSYMMELPTDYSMREILGYIGAANAGNWIITDEGKLRLIRVDETVDSSDIGLSAKTYHIGEPYQEFSKVEIDLTDELYVESGDTTGRTLTTVIPVVTTSTAETIAAAILTALDGFVYTPYTADGAILDPAYEIGDAVTISTTTGILANQIMRLNSLCPSDLSSPGDEAIDHEYPYESTVKRTVQRQISKINTTLFVGPDSIVGRVEGLEEDYSEISQTLNSITLSVTTTSGVASIVLSVDGSTAGSGTIDMTGMVTFTDLQTSGSTTINGDNITTGTISANVLKVNTVYSGDNDTYRILSSRIAEPSQIVTRQIVNLGHENVGLHNESHLVSHCTAFMVTSNNTDDVDSMTAGMYISSVDKIMTPISSGSTASMTWTLGGPRWGGDSDYGFFSYIYMGAEAYLYVDQYGSLVFHDKYGNETTLT